MRIYVLFGMPIDEYDNVYPEPLDACGEGAEEDAPEFFAERLQKARQTGAYGDLHWVALRVDEAKVMAALQPIRKPLPASVVTFRPPKEKEA